MSGIFLNFRSSDAGSYAAVLLDDALSRLLGNGLVFRSSRSIPAGVAFDAELLAALERCDVMLVLIGRQWLSALTDSVRHPGQSEDWVVKEIGIALRRDIRVIPVLLTGAELPAEADLPAEISGLARRQTVRLRHRHIDSDLRHLLSELARASPGLISTVAFAPATSLPRPYAPSMLLRPEYGIVKFTGRKTEIAAMRTWTADQAPVAAHLITAPAGQGKTRLALHLCDLMRQEGWFAGMVAENIDAEILASVASAPVPLLLVVDYAEGRAAFLAAAAAIAAQRGSGVRTRLLMLARSAGEWQEELREHPDDRVAAVFLAATEHRLRPLTAGMLDRQAEFTRALAALSHELGYGSEYFDPPPGLDSASYDRVLDIHAVALATLLDEHAPDHDGSDPSWDPVARVLHHECRYWRRTTAAYELPDPSRARLAAVVAAATLFGAATTEQAAGLLGMLPTFRDQAQDVIRRYVTWAGRLYPGSLALNPLRPDRLGEDHVAATLLAEPSITDLASAIDDAQLRQAVTVLGRAAPRHAALVGPLTAVAARTGRRFIDLAIAIATQLTDPRPITGVLRDAVDADPESDLTEFLLDRLPETTIALADLALRANERALEAHLLLADKDPAVTAHLLNRLARRLRGTGQAADALLAITQSTEIYRRLAGQDNDTYLPHLLGSMHIQSICLSETGELQDALAVSLEAVAGYRRLAEVRPDAYLSELANAMASLSNRLRAVDRRQEATAAAVDATELYFKLWDAGSASAIMPDMARSLHNLGVNLRESGQATRALEVLEDAADLRRRLAEQSPDTYLAELASSLNARANCLDDLGRADEAAVTSAETVEIYQKLAEHRPETFLADLAMSLNNHALNIAAVGHSDDAVATIVEAVGVYRRLALDQPEVFGSDLAMALSNLSLRLGRLGRHDEALEAVTEAVEIRRRLAKADTPEALRGLAIALNNLGIRLRALGRHAEAVPAAQEAVGLFRTLSDRESAHLPHLADALNGLALAMIRIGRAGDGLAAGIESIETFRALRFGESALYGRQLASALTNCAAILEHIEPDQAIAFLHEAYDVCDPAANADLAEEITKKLHILRTPPPSGE